MRIPSFIQIRLAVTEMHTHEQMNKFTSESIKKNLRRHIEERRRPDQQKSACDKYAANHSDVFGLDARLVADPAPEGGRQRVDAAVDDEHKAQDHGGEMEL